MGGFIEPKVNEDLTVDTVKYVITIICGHDYFRNAVLVKIDNAITVFIARLWF